MRKTNSYWTIKNLFDNRHQIEFPEYQREPTVWSLEKKQRLIDSILRGIDIASIYLFKKEESSYDCIDGRQRINAILSYLGENPTDTEDSGFYVTITNEIFEDSAQFAEINNKRFRNLPEDAQAKIWDYRISTVIIESVENVNELNLFFLRLQLGQILNAGEKLHAMIGDMREFIFNDIGRNEFFQGINIPYRRYAKEQVAAQIALNYFRKKETGEYRRSRYLDLQEFFKERSKFSEKEIEITGEIKQKLSKIYDYFKDVLYLIGNRAMAVSVFLFISDLIDQERESESEQFIEFFIKLVQTLKWQIPEGVQMHEAYYYLLDFQNYVSQAAGEKYAIQNRHDFLDRNFYYYKQNNVLEGDDKYFESTGKKADAEREVIQL